MWKADPTTSVEMAAAGARTRRDCPPPPSSQSHSTVSPSIPSRSGMDRLDTGAGTIETGRTAGFATGSLRCPAGAGRCFFCGCGSCNSNGWLNATADRAGPPSASASCPSVIVITTSFEVIGGMPSAETVALLGRSSRQVLKLPITKSDRVAVGLWDDRVSAMKLAKQLPRPSAVRSTPSSRNSPAAGLVRWLLSSNAHGTAIGPVLTIAKVVPVGVVTGTRLPVASLPVHRNTLMVETPPPWVKSLTRRMSPSAWVPTNGLPLLVGELVLSPIGFWKNQKPAVASPLLSNRSSPAYRMMCPLLGSVYMAA